MARGFQDFLGGAIQGFGQTFFPQLEQMRAQHVQKQEQAQQQSLLNQALTQAQKVYADPNLSPEQKQIGLFQALSNRPEIAKALGEQLISQQKALQPKAPPGGLGGQPVPQEVSGAIQDVLSKNPEASADQLKAAFDVSGLPPAYTNPYVENRRESTKKVYEPESEKLEAKRQAEYADKVVKEYNAANTENMRLDKQEELSKSGKLSTPLMVQTLNSMGLPLSILGNPATEEYAKVEADFVRDVSQVFPGQIRNFEIVSYMKTIPSLLNSDEGKRAIIRNRRILNQGKIIEYNAYKDILKENKGKKPPNMDVLIEERIGPQKAALAQEFRKSMNEESDKFETKFTMVDSQGRTYQIPASKAEQATKDGLRFR